MKLGSLLNLMDNCIECIVWDDNLPIDNPPLFKGMVGDCKKRSDIKNGIVKFIIPVDMDRLDIFIDIEYQKKKLAERSKE